MNKVRQRTSVHEETVKNAQVHADSYKKSRARNKGHRSSRVTRTQVREDVWAKVKEILANGSYTRFEIVDDETVRVR